MEAEDLTTLMRNAEYDAAWIFDIYAESGDDKHPTRGNEIRARLRAMARRHRRLARLVAGSGVY